MLAGFRQSLNTATDAMRAKVDELEPRLRELEERLKQLGPAPAKDAPPEAEEVTNERDELTATISEVDGALKQARVLAVRIEQLSERLAQKRHALYAGELFARSPSILDPFFWLDAFHALPIELRSGAALYETWISERPEGMRWIAAALIVIALAAIVFGLSRWWFSRLFTGPFNTRSEKAWAALWIFVWLAARTPLAGLAALVALDTLGLLTWRVEQIAQGIVVGIAAAAFGRGIARALFAPEQPERRLVQEDDDTARFFHSHLVWATRALGVMIILQVVHKALFAPLIITVATNALFGAVAAAFLSDFVFRLGRIKRRDGTALGSRAMGPSLGRGRHGGHHPGAGHRICRPRCVRGAAGDRGGGGIRRALPAAPRHAVAVRGDQRAYLARAQPGRQPRGQPARRRPRRVAAIRHRPRDADRVRLPGDHRPVGSVHRRPVRHHPQHPVRVQDRRDSTSRSGRSSWRSSSWSVLLVVTRIVRRWLEVELLPRTTLEPSLQLSIATIFGYLGAIAAIAFALTGLGFDLQKIALIAGALSVGIGFGLQSVVANFVSGLILLTERPVRVGDSIVVKGEEGWVRRVRVRATEIETFDRASVIIPNSELITGIVKNWTRVNTLGRIIVKVGVGYESDPAQVRDILLDIAGTHPQIAQSPAPGAFLLGFGDSALEFELRCIVKDVEKGLSVRSDLHYAIIKRFREAGITIPYPQRELRVITESQKPAVVAS